MFWKITLRVRYELTGGVRKRTSQFCLSIQSKMSEKKVSCVTDKGGDRVVVEDLRSKMKRQREAKAKQTKALAASLVAAVRARDVKAAQQALVSVRQGKLDKLEVAELLVGQTSLKEWRKLVVMMEKMEKVKVENVEEDEKKRIVQFASAKKLPEVNCVIFFKLYFALMYVPGVVLCTSHVPGVDASSRVE